MLDRSELTEEQIPVLYNVSSSRIQRIDSNGYPADIERIIHEQQHRECGEKEAVMVVATDPQRVFTTSSKLLCHSQLNLAFRRKYCAARIEMPLPSHLLVYDYGNVAAEAHLNIAMHYRAGDIAYTPPEQIWRKRVDFQSAAATINAVCNAIERDFPSYTYTVHIFSQRPPDASDLSYFDPLLHDDRLRARDVRLYADFKSEASLHAMVTAPIFIGSGSGFSAVALMLRSGINVAQNTTATCVNKVAVKEDGSIDSQEFTKLLRQYLHRHSHQPLQYNSMRQCLEMEAWPSPSEAVHVIHGQ